MTMSVRKQWEEDPTLLVRGEHHDPHSFLGAHPVGASTVVHAFHPDATGVSLLATIGSAMTRIGSCQRSASSTST